VKKSAVVSLVTIAAAIALPQAAYAPPPPKTPQVVTGDATAIGQTTVTLNGTVNPRGTATTYEFDYGKTKSYGTSTAPVSAGSGTTAKSVSATATGLEPGTTYHFRIEATNTSGTVRGHDATFKTLPRLTAVAKPARLVFGSATTIGGQLLDEDHAGKTVELQANPYPYKGFVAVTTTTTSSTGSYAFPPVKPTRNTRYRTEVKDLSVKSAVLNVGVRIRLTRSANDATPAAGQTVAFSGFACPAHVGDLVSLQRRTSTGGWATVNTTHLVQAAATPACAHRSRYQVSIHVLHNRTFRVVAAADADHLRGISRSIAITVH
jgi:hypothetical protein